MRAIKLMTVVMAVAGLVACGGGNPGAPSGTGGAAGTGNPTTGTQGGGSGSATLRNGTVSATIDGARWTASVAIVASNRILPDGTPLFVLAASDGVRMVEISVVQRGPGTYANETGEAPSLSVSTIQPPVQAWVADRSSRLGGPGAVTLSTITASRAVGTFSFTAEASPWTAATGRKVVTNGTFDVTF